MSENRVVQVPLPARTIERLDRLIDEGRGGYRSRAEFIREAIEQLLDITVFQADAASQELDDPGSLPPPPQSPGTREPDLVAGATEIEFKHSLGRAREARDQLRHYRSQDADAPAPIRIEDPEFEAWLATINSPSEAAVHAPPLGATLGGIPDDFELDPGPLLGLHNRDWVSLWVLERLTRAAAEEPIQLDSFVTKVTDEAWALAAALARIESREGRKLSTGLPSNPEKRQSSEEGFRSFAIGTVYRRRQRQTRRLSGALYTWRTVGVALDDKDELLVAPSTRGHRLLEQVEGISLQLPHPPGAARAFMLYLRENAVRDFEGFAVLLQAAIRFQPTRSELLVEFKEAFPSEGWSESVLSTNVAGFVARAREWGLIERKLSGRRYAATPEGTALFQELLG